MYSTACRLSRILSSSCSATVATAATVAAEQEKRPTRANQAFQFQIHLRILSQSVCCMRQNCICRLLVLHAQPSHGCTMVVIVSLNTFTYRQHSPVLRSFVCAFEQHKSSSVPHLALMKKLFSYLVQSISPQFLGQCCATTLDGGWLVVGAVAVAASCIASLRISIT